MAKASHARLKLVSPGPDKVAGEGRQGRRSIAAVMRFVRECFGSKTALELALRTGADQRSGERWLSGKSMEAENLCALIRSDVGDGTIEAIMGGDERQWPSWYGGFRKQVKLAQLRRDLAKQQRELAALEQGAL